MSDRRFYFLAWTALVAFVVTASVAAIAESVGVLFSVLLGGIGIYGGYLCNEFVAKKSRDESLSRYASAGHRLSLDVYDALQEVLDVLSDADGSRALKVLSGRMEVAREKLRTVQRFALSSNQQWEKMLSTEKVEQTRARETRLQLKTGRTLVVTETEGQG